MKQFLKLTIALILGVVALGFQSCGSDDDEPDAKIKVTQTEIQGKWHNATYGSYHHFPLMGISIPTQEWMFAQATSNTWKPVHTL